MPRPASAEEFACAPIGETLLPAPKVWPTTPRNSSQGCGSGGDGVKGEEMFEHGELKMQKTTRRQESRQARRERNIVRLLTLCSTDMILLFSTRSKFTFFPWAEVRSVSQSELSCASWCSARSVGVRELQLLVG